MDIAFALVGRTTDKKNKFGLRAAPGVMAIPEEVPTGIVCVCVCALDYMRCEQRKRKDDEGK
jgi:hypothetical protein